MIAAVVIGGTSLMGGRGSIISTFFGVLIISVLAAGLAQIGATDPTKLYDVYTLKRPEVDLKAGLQQALAKLDDRSRHIVQSRWLADDGGATLQDLADEYGVSAERIRQIEAKALKSLRTHLVPA